MRIIVAFMTGCLLLLSTLPATASVTLVDENFAVYNRTLVRGALPDECYYGLGSSYNVPTSALYLPLCGNQPSGQPKVNASYVWGLTQSGNYIWWGTMANTQCLVEGAYLGWTTGNATDAYVCELGSGKWGLSVGLPPGETDWRPPQIWLYDPTQSVSGTNPLNVTKTQGLTSLMSLVVGFRSAGALTDPVLGDVVLLAGPALSAAGGLYIFAFNPSTTAFIGYEYLPNYSDIRHWVSYNGVLYTAVENTGGGGSVLRWDGYTLDPNYATNHNIMIDLEVVGNLDSEGSDLVEHNGLLYAATWPTSTSSPVVAGLWMSPPIPAGGLTSANASHWSKVWQFSQYEPDPLIAYTYGGGPLASFNGYLYWSSMHVPLVSFEIFERIYGGNLNPYDPANQQVEYNTWRAGSIFRSKGFDTANPSVQLLYGETDLPVYHPGPGEPLAQPLPPGTLPTGTWVNTSNNMNQSPRYGSSGLNNIFNNYIWSMAIHDGQLFVGTMDSGFLVSSDPSNPGGDLYRFLPADIPAIAESLNGIGNYTNYGVRNLLSTTTGLYAGMANPMNLSVNTPDNQDGGWELVQLTGRQGIFPPEGKAGSAFSITGSGFGKKKGKVTMGNQSVSQNATILYWSDNYIYCNVNAQATKAKKTRPLSPGVYNVTVKTKGGSTPSYTFTVLP
ncbi:MAG: IPT/TIG domain-containing protein [Dissulfurispiraceae bacterium]